jgi:uncharacterized protein (TIGR01777 family)
MEPDDTAAPSNPESGTLKIVIAGGSGFLGRPLAERLASEGHRVVVLGRHRPSTLSAALRFVEWPASGDAGSWIAEVGDADAVVNLAGESIAGRRWSAAHKARILDSRINATRALARAISGSAQPPAVFISGSAVGYYGPLGDDVATEEQPAGSDFLAGVCVQWEAEAARAATSRTRVACVRTGIVLERDGATTVKVMADASSRIGNAAFQLGATYRVTGFVGQRATHSGALDGYRIWVRDPADVNVVTAATVSPAAV